MMLRSRTDPQQPPQATQQSLRAAYSAHASRDTSLRAPPNGRGAREPEPSQTQKMREIFRDGMADTR